MEFKKTARSQTFEQSKNQLFDILIVGGGITGAGIALEASSRGLSTFLVEKDDFAEGTSSKSTKLVHGGLRYLKNIELKLVRTAGRERAILYQNAAHIVYPQKMILPIYKGQLYGRFLTSLGLWIYDLLAGVETQYKKQNLNKKKILERLPQLKKEGLKGAVQYYEYRTQDSRLVIENIKKAIEFGAIGLNYTELIKIDNKNKTTVKAKIYDKLEQKEYEIKAKLIINATGVWANDFLRENKITKQTYILPSKGIHILVDKQKVPIQTPVYFELKDERMIFAIPADNKVYIGTTDDVFKNDLDSVYAEKKEVNYLIEAFNTFFDLNLTIDDIEITWAGLRPLLKSNNNQIDKLSRKEKIIVHNNNIVSVLGGKLTAYRWMAEKTVDKIIALLSESETFKKSWSKKIPLSGAEFNFGKVENHKIIEYIERRFYEAYQLNADTQLINTLFYTYGTNIEKIIEYAFDIYNELENRSLVWLEAEIWYVVNYEMLVNLSDFMIRRTQRFFFRHTKSMEQIDDIANIIAKHLGWNKIEIQRQIKNYKKIADRNRSFKNDIY